MEANAQAIYRLKLEEHLWRARAAKAEDDRSARWAKVNEARDEMIFRAVVISGVLFATFLIFGFAGAALLCQDRASDFQVLGILILGGCWVGVVWACLHFVFQRRHK